MKTNRPTRAALERKVMELQAQLAGRYASADRDIDAASTNKMMASGVILQLHALGGRSLIDPVMIYDGLSQETIAAIRQDLRRSYAHAVQSKPQGVA